METLARPGWITSSTYKVEREKGWDEREETGTMGASGRRWMVLTNCFRERRRLVMNLRVRRVTAVLALESAMVGRWKLDAPPRGREGELGAREERGLRAGWRHGKP